MTRVLSISTLFPCPGRPQFGIFVANSMKAVARLPGIDLTMINPIGVPPWPLSLREPYASLRRIPATSDLDGLTVHHRRFPTIPRFGAESNPRRIAAAILPMARKLHAQRPFDLIDAQFFFPDGPAAAIVARDLGLPLSIKARGADIHHWSWRPKAGPQIRAAAQQAAGLLAVSEAMREDMAALGMPAERIVVHYTGLDQTGFHPIDRGAARAALSTIPHGGPLLVSTGALIARKGQQFVIEALLALPEAQLALAGAGEDEKRLRALALRLGVADRVHFLGVVSHADLPGLLAAADAMVLPSASEGLANAWVEALACGTPLVITDSGGAREVVRDASAGRIAERSPEAIAEAVRAILADPPAQAAVAANAERFSWENNAAALADYWRRLVGGQATSR
jgi:glycosyltransferase involved in cell wall biosynthesis